MTAEAFARATASIALGGRVPGVLTALAVEPPASWMVPGRGWREQRHSCRAMAAAGLVIAALCAVPARVFTEIGA